MENSITGALDAKGSKQRFDQILLHSESGSGKQAVTLKPTNLIIGYCGVEPFDLAGNIENELGYRLIPQYRGLGLATEAAQAVSNKYFGALFAYVDSENSKSINVLSNIGFSYTGKCSVNGREYELFQRIT